MLRFKISPLGRSASVLAVLLATTFVPNGLAFAEMSDAAADKAASDCAARGGEVTWNFNADGSVDSVECNGKGWTIIHDETGGIMCDDLGCPIDFRSAGPQGQVKKPAGGLAIGQPGQLHR